MIQHFPDEIVSTIACLLEQNDALHLSYTCKHLHQLVQPRLFYAVVVDSSKKVYNYEEATSAVEIPSFGERTLQIIPTVISSLYSLNSFFKFVSKHPWMATRIRYLSFSEQIPDLSDLCLIENLEFLLPRSSSLRVFHWYSHGFDLPSSLVSGLSLVHLHGNFTHTDGGEWVHNEDLATLNISSLNDPKWLAGLNICRSHKLRELVISKTKTSCSDFKYHRGSETPCASADANESYISQLFSNFCTQMQPLQLTKLALKGLTLSAREAERLCECVELEKISELSVLDCTELLPPPRGRSAHNMASSFLEVLSPRLHNLRHLNISLVNASNYHSKTFNFLGAHDLRSLNITVNVNNHENVDSQIEHLFASIRGDNLEFLNFDYNVVHGPTAVQPSHKHIEPFAISTIRRMSTFTRLRHLQLPIARYRISNLLPLLRGLRGLDSLSLNMRKFGGCSSVATKNVQTLISQEFLDFYAANAGCTTVDASQYQNYVYDLQHMVPCLRSTVFETSTGSYVFEGCSLRHTEYREM